jgi:hypothetical protein
MTERSFYWANTATGDGSLSPYDNDEFSDIWRKLFMRNRNTQGHIEGYLSELEVTNPSGNTIRVADGAALVDGKFYENDANVDNAIATPAVSTRFDRVVLQKSWAAQTVRIAILTGIEGGGIPALTQNDGVTWEIPLATVEITTAPVITITDERETTRSPLVSQLSGSLVEIETIFGSGDINNITFDNIPAHYTHLLISGSGRSDAAFLEINMVVRFNGDVGANYQYQDMRGEGVVNSASAATAQTFGLLGQIPATNATENHPGVLELLIPNYNNTTFFKRWISRLWHIPNNTTADFSLVYSGGQWDNASVINTVALLLLGAGTRNFVSESVYTLYGIL